MGRLNGCVSTSNSTQAKKLEILVYLLMAKARNIIIHKLSNLDLKNLMPKVDMLSTDNGTIATENVFKNHRQQGPLAIQKALLIPLVVS